MKTTTESTTARITNPAMSSSLITFRTLSLKAADEIASFAIQIAQRNAFAPIAVCVMDASGYPIVSKRMDKCPAKAFAKMAEHKATTCVTMKMSTRAYGNKYLSSTSTPDMNCRLLNQIAAVQGEAVAFPGGIVLKCSESNEIVGSVGVSGASGAEDEYIGLRAVQLSSIRSDVITEPKEHMCLTVMDGLSS
jgi:uncharacterized protein GlcG (DUF336 family)